MKITLETTMGQQTQVHPNKRFLCNANDAIDAGVEFDRCDISEGQILLEACEFPIGQTIHTYDDGWCCALTRIQ